LDIYKQASPKDNSRINNLDAMGFVTHFHLLTVLLFGLIWIGIAAFLRLNKKKSLVYLLFFTIFYIYLFKVLDYTLFQFQSLLLLKHFAPNLMLNGQAAGKSLNLIPFINLTPEDLKTSLLNILLLIPFGFGLPFVTNFRMKKVVVIGALFSIGIEFLQLITGFMGKITFRIADINDVIFNTVGALVGYILFVGFMRIYRQISHNWKISANPILRYVAERPQIDNKGVSKKLFIAMVIVAAAAGFFGYKVYHRSQLQESFGRGASGGQSDRIGNGEGKIPQSGDLCGGTGGNGQIVSVGNNSFTIKLKNGISKIVNLTSQITIKTSTGSGSVSDLKTGDRVTLVGDPNPDGSFTANTVVVCTATSPETQSGQ
jgi:glycopeptide antibiotics resistance protein